MSSNPFRRPPMVDIPWGERERWWDRTTRRLAEAKLWDKAESLADLGELVAQFAEGKLLATPDHGGDRDPETVQIAEPLAHANRQGFVTGGSQPGKDGPVWEQRAAVQGWASPETVEKLRRLVAGTRLQIQVAAERPRRTDYSNAVNVSRTVAPDGVHEHTGFGAVPGRHTSFVDLGRSDLTEGAAHVTIYDPEWGDHSLLWDRLGQADWDDPPPTEPEKTVTDEEAERAARIGRDYGDFEAEQRRRAEAARTQPPEPPVGTVLETRDDFTGDYRIEHTDDGWRQQYHDGESPDGSRTSPTFGGRGISWRAAWSAWGPPSGAAPFREVPANSPLLPAYPDVSGDRLDPPPAVEPYTPPAHIERQVCEPQKTTPPTGGTTNGSTGGTGMSITDARSTIMSGHQTGQDALRAIGQAHEMVGDARNDLWQATEGSNQAESEAARAQLTEAMTKLEEAEQQVASALQEFENVANRL